MAIKIAAYDKLMQAETAAVAVAADETAWPQGFPEALAAAVDRLRKLGDLTGKRDELHVLYPEGRGPKRLIVCGLGETAKLTLQEVRRTAGRAVKRAQALRAKELTLAVETFAAGRFEAAAVAQELALAGPLALYRYREYKADEPPAMPRLVLASRKPAAIAKAADAGEAVAEAANVARTLANRPGNALDPQALAREAKALARKHPALRVTVIPQAQLARAGFGALLAVGSGSAHPPLLIEAVYSGGKPRQAPIALVGKGITFDSGGIDLKPGAKMEDMKFDMSGGAAVLGTLLAAARLKLPVNLVGIVPAAENLPSGTAYRPGDILTSLSGQTIEVLNTDAEGRLILADALTYARRHKPSCIVDLATLTGAVTVALGAHAIGLLGNDPGLSDALRAAGEASGERCWPLPLWDEYREMIKSEIADMSNISPKPGAGTIVGAAFLEKFAGPTPWAHLDIAGTAYGDGNGLYAKGATGVGVRLLIEWLKGRK